jgi:hypothetical protein
MFMGRLMLALTVLPFLATNALPAERLSKKQLERITIAAFLPNPNSLSKIGAVCNFSDCISTFLGCDAQPQLGASV